MPTTLEREEVRRDLKPPPPAPPPPPERSDVVRIVVGAAVLLAALLLGWLLYTAVGSPTEAPIDTVDVNPAVQVEGRYEPSPSLVP